MDDVSKDEKPLPEPRDMQEFLGLAAQVAKDTDYVRNTRWQNAMVHFPVDPLMRTVEKYFKHAKGGPLFVDTPQTLKEVEDCKVKAMAMAKEGLRYCYIAPEMELEDVTAQLEEKTLGLA